MLSSQAYGILSLLAGASVANAHGYVYSWTVNGETMRGASPGEGSDGAALPTDNTDWADRDGAIAACGGTGTASSSWSMAAGSEVIAQWTGPSNGNSVWPPEHYGPVIEYMARCPGTSCSGVEPASLDWFKISEASWDGSKWPSTTINEQDNWSFKIPSDIAPGPYLVRTEILAMHYEWEKGGFQVYPNCFAADVTGSGSAAPSDTATFPDIYDPSSYTWYDYDWRGPGDGDPRDPADYVPPGPAVYTGGGASAPPAEGGDTSTSATVPSASTPVDSSETDAPSPTDGGGDPEATDSEAPEASSTDEETSPTSVPAESSSVSSGSGGSASKSRTRTRWRNWKTKSSTAAAAVETDDAEEEETDNEVETDNEDEEEEYRKRNILGRHEARQLVHF